MGDQGNGRYDNAVTGSDSISDNHLDMLPLSLISEMEEKGNVKQANATIRISSSMISSSQNHDKKKMSDYSVPNYSGDNAISTYDEKKPLVFLGGSQAEGTSTYNPGREHVPSNSIEEKGKTTYNPVLQNNSCAREYPTPLPTLRGSYAVGEMPHNTVQSKLSGMIHSTTTAMSYDGCSTGREEKEHVAQSKGIHGKGMISSNHVVHNDGCIWEGMISSLMPQGFQDRGKMSYNPFQSTISSTTHSTTITMARKDCRCSRGLEEKKPLASSNGFESKGKNACKEDTVYLFPSGVFHDEPVQSTLGSMIRSTETIMSRNDGGCHRDGKEKKLFPSSKGTQQERKFTYSRVPCNMGPVTKPPRIIRKKKASITQGDPSKQPCSVCGRVFKSWMALGGHMRAHPDREWRGILPPMEMPKGSSSDKDYAKHWSPLFNYGLILLADVALSMNNKETEELTNTSVTVTKMYTPTQEKNVGLSLQKKDNEELASRAREETKIDSPNLGKEKSEHRSPTDVVVPWGPSEVHRMTTAIKEATFGFEVRTPEWQPNNHTLEPYSMFGKLIETSKGYSAISNLEILSPACMDPRTPESQFLSHNLPIGSNSVSNQNQSDIKEQSAVKRCLDINLNLPPTFEEGNEHQDSFYTDQ